MDKVFNVKEARKKLGQLIEQAYAGPVILTRRGNRSAVLVSLERYKQLEHLAQAAAGRQLEAALERLNATMSDGAGTEVVAEAVARVRSGQSN